MKECWINVYASQLGFECPTRRDAQVANGELPGGRKNFARYRLHVKLKPEGAPKRYADSVDRWVWEN